MPEPDVERALDLEEQRRRRTEAMELPRKRALAIHDADPELPLADIARRLGVRRKSVSDWVNARRKG